MEAQIPARIWRILTFGCLILSIISQHDIMSPSNNGDSHARRERNLAPPVAKFMVRAAELTSYAEDCPSSWPQTFPDCANKPVMSLEEIPYSPSMETLNKLKHQINSDGTINKSTTNSDLKILGKIFEPKTMKVVLDTSKYSLQSPIDIRHTETIKTPEGSPENTLFFRNYDLTSQDWRLEKTRATVMLKTDSVLPFIEIPEAFEFRQAHFHWGPGGGSLVGSEHSVDGQFYALEAHLLHESKVTPNSFAVIAILYDVPAITTEYNARDETNGGRARKFYQKIWNEGHNPRIEPIVRALKAEQNGGSPHMTPAETGAYDSTGGKPIIYLNGNDKDGEFTLYSLLPSEWDGSFYRYHGSLSTPPCSPTVTWFVISKVGTISRDQLEVFQNLRQCEHPALLRKGQSLKHLMRRQEPGIKGSGHEKDTRGKCYPDLLMGPNRRPIQAPNYRPIYYVAASNGISNLIPVKLQQPLKEIGTMLGLSYILMKLLQILE